MFRSRAAALDWEPRDGMQVEVRALPTLYEPRGPLPAHRRGHAPRRPRAALRALPAAQGEARRGGPVRRARSSARCRAFPARIGVVTSLAAAALRDVLTTLARRNPAIPVIVYPVPVQGEGAADRIVTMLARASAARRVRRAAPGARRRLDRGPVAVQRRGVGARDPRLPDPRGGRASATKPISPSPISPPTRARRRRPLRRSSSARRARSSCTQIAECARRLCRETQRKLQYAAQALDACARRLVHPAERLRSYQQLVTQLNARLAFAFSHKVHRCPGARWHGCRRRLRRLDPTAVLAARLQHHLRRLRGGVAGSRIRARRRAHQDQARTRRGRKRS